MYASIDGVRMTARDAEADKLAEVEVDLDGKTLRGWTAISREKTVPPLLQHCELYALMLLPQKLDQRDGARLDVACRNGEDMYTVKVVTLLIDKFEPYHVLWIGESYTLTSENEACISEHLVDFELKGKTLTQKITDRSRTNKDGSCTPGGKPGKQRVTKSTKTIKL